MCVRSSRVRLGGRAPPQSIGGGRAGAWAAAAAAPRTMKLRKRSSTSEADVPLAIREFTERAIAAPFDALDAALAGFAWEYERGDLHHWVDLLNAFDELLERHVAPRADLHLRAVRPGEAPPPPLPAAQLLALLRVTTVILDNCSNKHSYGSVEVRPPLARAAGL